MVYLMANNQIIVILKIINNNFSSSLGRDGSPDGQPPDYNNIENIKIFFSLGRDGSLDGQPPDHSRRDETDRCNWKVSLCLLDSS